jgi:acyl-CoA thioesterase-1
MPIQFVKTACLCLLFISARLNPCEAQSSSIEFRSPQPWQVFQRIGFDPDQAKSASNERARGAAEVAVVGTFLNLPPTTELEYRLKPFDGLGHAEAAWKPLTMRVVRQNFDASVVVPAGGWYHLEVRIRSADSSDDQVFQTAQFGVGEVFVVAGQSYATNTNDERLKVADAKHRVVSLDTTTGGWREAHDPQPTPDGSDGGSIWPATGDLLVEALQVPVGFVNVAWGGTSSAQWLPGEKLHTGLIQGGHRAGHFRAVLWQQGESDVIEGTSAEQYIANIKSTQRAALRAWGFEPVWLLAKSTHHPTVYHKPEEEQRIRGAIEQLSAMQGFGAGPDTDTLQGENRGDAKSRRHFSPIGQQRAAKLWADALLARIQTLPAGIDAASFLLPELHLLEPVWASSRIHRESCIVTQQDDSSPLEAALAFTPSRILRIATADRQMEMDVTAVQRDTSTPNRLLFPSDIPVQAVSHQQLYLPAGAPNSYPHRVNNPAEHLMYQPGRWFHDRNLEITYERDLQANPIQDLRVVHGSLPRTEARLTGGASLTIGISGDSISTGLDSSFTTAAPPFQPGYPDLVAAQLRVVSSSDIQVKNRSVSGWSVADGVADLDALLAEKPNLIVVAYGMNDVGRRNPDWFLEQTKTLVDRIRAAAPETDVLLVTPMLGNREWTHTPREMFAAYRDAILGLVGPGVAMVDVTAVWDHLLGSKSDLDLTGNGLNHPNDFGHRLYAQAVLQALVRIQRADSNDK